MTVNDSIKKGALADALFLFIHIFMFHLIDSFSFAIPASSALAS